MATKEEYLRDIEDKLEDIRRWVYDERRGRAGWRDHEDARRRASELETLIIRSVDGDPE